MAKHVCAACGKGFTAPGLHRKVCSVLCAAELNRQRRKAVVDVDRIGQLYRSGLTHSEIAAELGLCKSTTSRILRELGHRRNRSAAPLPSVEVLWQDYKALGSVHKVGERHGGATGETVRRHLKAAGYRLKGEDFSPEDDEKIRRYCAETPYAEFRYTRLAELLGRPCHTSVCRRAGQIGVKKPPKPEPEPKQGLTLVQRAAMSERMKARHASHPHPMLGKKHPPETRAVISEKSRAWQATLSPEQRQEMAVKGMKTRMARGPVAPPRPQASWKAGWHEIGDKRHYFRSKWEVNYAHYLQWLKTLGQIKEWEYEVETFWFEGVKRGTVSYLPDFRVTENDGRRVYHEIKGWMDDRSKTKLARMKKYHPTVALVLIDGPAYKALSRKVAGLVPGWS